MKSGIRLGKQIKENGNAEYGKDEREGFIEAKARFNYELYDPKTTHMNGVSDPNDFVNGEGKTLKEVYDSSFVDFKELIPKKNKVDIPENSAYLNGASNLNFITPDTWVYENEKPENGGQILNGLYASDPSVFSSNALF